MELGDDVADEGEAAEGEEAEEETTPAAAFDDGEELDEVALEDAEAFAALDDTAAVDDDNEEESADRKPEALVGEDEADLVLLRLDEDVLGVASPDISPRTVGCQQSETHSRRTTSRLRHCSTC